MSFWPRAPKSSSYSFVVSVAHCVKTCRSPASDRVRRRHVFCWKLSFHRSVPVLQQSLYLLKSVCYLYILSEVWPRRYTHPCVRFSYACGRAWRCSSIVFCLFNGEGRLHLPKPIVVRLLET